MKSSTALALFMVLVSTLAHGETFIGPTTATNRLLVPSNSAIIITATFGDFTNSTQVALGEGGIPFPQNYFAPLENGSSYALRSEEHTSELQSHSDLVCRLLLEKKKHHITL